MTVAATLNFIDRLVAFVDPSRGVRRMAARTVLQASYESGERSRLRKFRADSESPNQLVSRSAAAVRAQARYLERNHDIARGILRTMTNNIVGADGIGVEFQPRRKDGTIHTEYATALAEAWRDWCRRPEVTQAYSWSRLQRLICKTWIRDGEAFAQRLMGPVPNLLHGTNVPYSLEVMEADMLPLDFDDEAKNISQAIERNAWGRRVAAWVYKGHPLEQMTLASSASLKRVSWDNMLQIALTDRIGQLRGVSEFASVITRLEDIKDYEESERVAARISAMLTAYVKRQAPDGGGYEGPAMGVDGKPAPRQLSLQPGMIIDSLAVGEEIGLIDSNRPNPNPVTFRSGQLRAAAAGVGASFSSISKQYDGTFSAQRQELVEQWVNYAVLVDEYVCQWVEPVVRDFIQVAHLSGVARMPADLKAGSHDDVLYVGQAMPWIDPMKEAEAFVALAKAGFISEPEVIRRAGRNPNDTLEQMDKWRQLAKSKGLVLSSDAANDKGAAAAAPSTSAAGDAGNTQQQ
jgi:lambda family phage portal protein